MRKISAIIILILAAAVCLFSCKKATDPAFYTVHFDVSYSAVSMDVPADVQVAEGETVSLPTIEAEPTPGNVFIWTADPTTKDRYDATQPVKEDITLYAVEVPKSYKIMYLFEFDGIVNAAENPTEYDSTEEIVLHAPLLTTVPLGYKFIKWCYADDRESDVTTIPAGTKGDIVLRADLIPVTYRVVYADLNGAENPNATSYLFGDEMTLEPLSEAGFAGFTAQKDPSLTVTALTPAFIVEHQSSLFNGGYIYLKANWSKEQ